MNSISNIVILSSLHLFDYDLSTIGTSRQMFLPFLNHVANSNLLHYYLVVIFIMWKSPVLLFTMYHYFWRNTRLSLNHQHVDRATPLKCEYQQLQIDLSLNSIWSVCLKRGSKKFTCNSNIAHLSCHKMAVFADADPVRPVFCQPQLFPSHEHCSQQS